MNKGLLNVLNAALGLGGISPITMAGDGTVTLKEDDAETVVAALGVTKDLKTQVTTLTGEKTTLTATIATLTGEKATLTAEKTTLETTVGTLNAEVAAKDARIVKLCDQVTRLGASPAGGENPAAETETALGEDKTAKYLNNANNKRFNN